MSVQAQHPSNVIFSEFRKRARQEAGDVSWVMPVQERQLHFTSTGHDFSQTPVVNAGIEEEIRVSGFSGSERNKLLEESKQQCLQPVFNPTHGDGCSLMLAKDNGRSSLPCSELNLLHPVSWAWSPAIRSAADNMQVTPTSTFTMDVGANPNTAFCSLLDDASLNLHYWQQGSEIDHVIATHSELLKQTLEEKRQQHTRALLEMVDYGILSLVRERMVEIEKLKRRNVELEQYVKKLSIEAQVWMNVAQSQEALVNSLRSNLDKVLAQRNGKGRSGDSCAEDAESCVFGASLAANDVDLRPHNLGEQTEDRKCRHCGKNGISVLVVPCRHLCLCTDCDPTVTKCPICRTLKSASLQVYMD